MAKDFYSVTAPELKTAGPYSMATKQAMGDGSILYFLSGQTPFDPKTGKLVEGDLQAQTRQCFANLKAVLSADKLTLDEVVKVTVFLTEMNDFAAMNEVYKEEFREPYPARSTIGVAALPLGARVEIEMTAIWITGKGVRNAVHSVFHGKEQS